MRISAYLLCLLLPFALSAADQRLLLRHRWAKGTGVSVYDINDSHKLLRKIEAPETGDYKGISASVSH